MNHLDLELVVLSVLIIAFLSLLGMGFYDANAPLTNIESIEGEITSISDIKRNVVYIVDNESFTCKGLPIDNVNLNIPCKIYYGFSPILGKKTFVRIEYLE